MADDRSWGHRTRTFRALGHQFRLRTTDPAQGRLLGALFDAFPPADGPATWYSLIEEEQEAGPHWRILFGSELVGSHNRPNVVLQLLVSHLNRTAVATTADRLMLHAAVAARGGAAVVIPGAPDAGKSTLVAALLSAGFEYLSDEVAAIDLRTGSVDAYPKPLALDRRSMELLPALTRAVRTSPDLGLLADGERYLNPRWVRRDAVARHARLALIVVPHLRPGAQTSAQALPRADALAACHANGFNFATLGKEGFHALAALLQRCSTLELTGGDLTSSVAHIDAALMAASAT